jgi:LacI family transcriptional regulator
VDYAADHGRWKIACSMEADTAALQYIKNDFDGAIVRVLTPRMRTVVKSLSFPVVNVSGTLEEPGVPSVLIDNFAAGRLCGEFLLRKGFRRFAAVHASGGWFNRERFDGFLHAVKGSEVHSIQFEQQPPTATDAKRFRQWIMSLRRPLALFLTRHESAQRLMNVCIAGGLRVPHDVAVIAGLGRMCDESGLPYTPSLSHVYEDEEEMIVAAARKLDLLMAGQGPAELILRIPPIGIRELESTNTVPVDDPAIAGAVEFIRGNLAEPMNIKTLAATLNVPRRTLDRHFASAMSMSVHEFLNRERAELAGELIRQQPPIPLAQIAKRCGFADARHMKKALRSAGLWQWAPRPAGRYRKGYRKPDQ